MRIVDLRAAAGRIDFDATLAVETSSEVELLVAGGILPLILAPGMLAAAPEPASRAATSLSVPKEI